MTFSGLGRRWANTNTTVEIYKVGSGWRQQTTQVWDSSLVSPDESFAEGHHLLFGIQRTIKPFRSLDTNWTTQWAHCQFSA